MQTTLTCAEESRAAEEQLAGTFKPADTFFLIESSLPDYGGWGASAVKSAATGGPFAPYLTHLQSTPRGKVLFIRRPQSQAKNFYIALTNQAAPKLYHAALSDFAELLHVEIDSLGADRRPRINGRDMAEVDELYTVCTNGRHDPCCAALGTPVYHELAAQAGADRVWQTTHIGGHRMAATLIAFPQGIVYGHVDPGDAEAIVTNHRAGYLLTYKYRGRGAYAGHWLSEAEHAAAAAAEALIRELTSSFRIDDLRLADVSELPDGARRVCFVNGASSYSADVKTRMSMPRQTSCGEPPKPMPQHEIAVHSLA